VAGADEAKGTRADDLRDLLRSANGRGAGRLAVWGVLAVGAFTVAFASWQYAPPSPPPPDGAVATGSLAGPAAATARPVAAGRAIPPSGENVAQLQRTVLELRQEVSDLRRDIARLDLGGEQVGRRLDSLEDGQTILTSRLLQVIGARKTSAERSDDAGSRAAAGLPKVGAGESGDHLDAGGGVRAGVPQGVQTSAAALVPMPPVKPGPRVETKAETTVEAKLETSRLEPSLLETDVVRVTGRPVPGVPLPPQGFVTVGGGREPETTGTVPAGAATTARPVERPAASKRETAADPHAGPLSDTLIVAKPDPVPPPAIAAIPPPASAAPSAVPPAAAAAKPDAVAAPPPPPAASAAPAAARTGTTVTPVAPPAAAAGKSVQPPVIAVAPQPQPPAQAPVQAPVPPQVQRPAPGQPTVLRPPTTAEAARAAQRAQEAAQARQTAQQILSQSGASSGLLPPSALAGRTEVPPAGRVAPKVAAGAPTLLQPPATIADKAASEKTAGEKTGDARTTFAVDLGGFKSLSALRRSWTVTAARHAQLTRGLTPLGQIRETGNAVEARLVAGPFENALDAAKFCAQIQTAGTACAPSVYVGQPIAP
jgi:hypothetical protein